ncbi:hypothetical protein CC2G_004857 [Coprinopsis cinerea AmutBmut pab1-1]|nr:hypothetical protein CC2G_004857 [Coprinopsis cinerea AmutBmut pab1-1]
MILLRSKRDCRTWSAGCGQGHESYCTPAPKMCMINLTSRSPWVSQAAGSARDPYKSGILSSSDALKSQTPVDEDDLKG